MFQTPPLMFLMLTDLGLITMETSIREEEGEGQNTNGGAVQIFML